MRAGKMGRREKADSSPVVSKLSPLINYLLGKRLRKRLGYARGEDGKAGRREEADSSPVVSKLSLLINYLTVLVFHAEY